MRTPRETFLQSLEHIELSLREVIRSSEWRQLTETGNYHPGLTVGDAIQAVLELAAAYEENAGVFGLEPGHPPQFQEFNEHTKNP